MFRRDIKDGFFRLIPLGEDVIATAVDAGGRCLKSTPPILLHASDGLHLATGMRLRCDGLATADVRMEQAARFLGVPRVKSG